MKKTVLIITLNSKFEFRTIHTIIDPYLLITYSGVFYLSFELFKRDRNVIAVNNGHYFFKSLECAAPVSLVQYCTR